MKPLHAVALGLVVIALYARAGGIDLLLDPLGWVLVLVGLRVLAEAVEIRFTAALWALGAAALVASAALSVPSVREWFEDADPALGWAVNIPAHTFCGLLCAALVPGARAAGDTAAWIWLQWTAVGFGVAVVAPVLVVGGGVDALEEPLAFVTGLAQLSLFVLCVAYGGRRWAGAPSRADPVPESDGT